MAAPAPLSMEGAVTAAAESQHGGLPLWWRRKTDAKVHVAMMLSSSISPK